MPRKKNTSQAESPSFQKVWMEIVKKCWSDPEFKKHFIQKAREVFAEYGLRLKAGKQIKIVEDTDQMIYLHYPQKTGLKKEQMQKIAGGGWLTGCEKEYFDSTPPPGAIHIL